MTREQAWELLCEYTQSDSLRRHALAVEACVTAYARKFGEGEAKWSETALLHDFDYEMHPNAPDHPMKGEAILAARGVEPEIRRAILSHANYSGVARESRPRENSVCLRRVGRPANSDCIREARPQHFRSRCAVGEEEAEGQGVRAIGEPGGYRERGARARGRAGRPYRVLYRGHEDAGGCDWRRGRGDTVESGWKLVLAGAGPGLQNQRAALCVAVGSTPTSFRGCFSTTYRQFQSSSGNIVQ